MTAVLRRATPLLLLLALVTPKSRAAEVAESTVDLTPRVSERDFAEVTVELEMGGTMKLREQSEKQAEERDLPMSVSAKLVYDEHRTAPTSGALATRSVRYYKEAGAVLKVDKSGKTPQLSDDRRLVVAQNPGGRLSFAAAGGLLNREELDLIDVTGDSLALDALLPGRAVATNENWPADPNTMAAILSMDSVAATEVQSTLDKFNHDFALVRLAGAVVGTADGTATEMEVRGVYLFDRKLRRVTRFNLAVKEKRSIGAATPGLEGVAKLRVNLKPLESSPHLLPATIMPLLSRSDLQLDTLRLEPTKQGYRLQHDRRWYVTREGRESTVLRLVDRGDLLAQCTITSLPSKSAGRQTTLEEFERDIRFAMKDNFGELVSSRQWTNSFGNHCLEIVVRGATEEVPLEWHYYLVAP
ncbi:MAG: hypothetical protein AB7I57_03300, partial [Pirellulales bacterium]